jgi:intracellular sulfur oxidation DsrE/DsrF family protein
MISMQNFAKGCLLVVLLTGVLSPAGAEQPPQSWDKVVFHIDDARTARWALMLARSYLDDVPTAKIAFVAYGPGVDFLLGQARDHRDDPYEQRVLSLVERGVDFSVCAATMSAREISRDSLLDAVKVVPSGISEIARLQLEAGYAYLKP